MKFVVVSLAPNSTKFDVAVPPASITCHCTVWPSKFVISAPIVNSSFTFALAGVALFFPDTTTPVIRGAGAADTLIVFVFPVSFPTFAVIVTSSSPYFSIVAVASIPSVLFFSTLTVSGADDIHVTASSFANVPSILAVNTISSSFV